MTEIQGLTHHKSKPIDRVWFLAGILLEEVMFLKLDPLVRDRFRKFLCPVLLRLLDGRSLVLDYCLERGDLRIDVLEDVESGRSLSSPNVDKGRVRWE